MTEPNVVLVGGLGKTGRRLLERLRSRGIAARAASRGTEPRSTGPSAPPGVRRSPARRQPT